MVSHLWILVAMCLLSSSVFGSSLLNDIQLMESASVTETKINSTSKERNSSDTRSTSVSRKKSIKKTTETITSIRSRVTKSNEIKIPARTQLNAVLLDSYTSENPNNLAYAKVISDHNIFDGALLIGSYLYSSGNVLSIKFNTAELADGSSVKISAFSTIEADVDSKQIQKIINILSASINTVVDSKASIISDSGTQILPALDTTEVALISANHHIKIFFERSQIIAKN